MQSFTDKRDMSLSNTFVIIKGEPKTYQIDKIDLGKHGVYAVKFKNSNNLV